VHRRTLAPLLALATVLLVLAGGWLLWSASGSGGPGVPDPITVPARTEPLGDPSPAPPPAPSPTTDVVPPPPASGQDDDGDDDDDDGNDDDDDDDD
jgi:hypothetical protein